VGPAHVLPAAIEASANMAFALKNSVAAIMIANVFILSILFL